MPSESTAQISGYRYSDTNCTCAHSYIMPKLLQLLNIEAQHNGGHKQVFDLGCGNGSVAARLTDEGFQVTGVDPSEQGILCANRDFPKINLKVGSAYDDLAGIYGQFDIVTSLEVVEHVYAPRDYARSAFNLLKPGGLAIISTPYNGYLKNLVIAVLGGFDRHATALWDHGHIKFWSVHTLSRLLTEAGFGPIDFEFVGRIRPLAKSMIALARRPV